jgi:alginate O-acetyltransferase complex protein AlgI
MLFNSYTFIFAFLPLTLAGYFVLGRFSARAAGLWLVLASFFFYGWWDARYVWLLLGSAIFNFAMGAALARKPSTALLSFAVAANLALLGYYKYANFFIDTANRAAGMQWGLAEIVLPLGISFFTFTQIAFLADARRGIARDYDFVHYLLFVSYFPHLIAGPLLHHKQMMPQFDRTETYRFSLDNMSAGLTFFALGLFKKVVLADQFATYASPMFDAAGQGQAPALTAAWTGALAYTLQLYFDFSGYSDMAVGLSRMFNVKLPFNFDSPYKSASVIEFWRRWHMTLSAFLRDYLYIPLGGNRHGTVRRYVNLLVTMVLGGLWHGAAWTFVAWGALHGAYLCVNHAWRALRVRFGFGTLPGARFIGIAVTFIAVVIAWVPFRSADFATTWRVVEGMAGANGTDWAKLVDVLAHVLAGSPAAPVLSQGVWLAIGLVIVFAAPNTQQYVHRYVEAAEPAPSRAGWWLPARGFAIGMVLFVAIKGIALTPNSPFLYFQF